MRAVMKKSSFFEEIREEGRIEARQDSLCIVLDERFGPQAAAESAPLIGEIRDLGRLRRLFRQAILSRRLSEFRLFLKPRKRPRTRKQVPSPPSRHP